MIAINSVEDLIKLYPNSFAILGFSKGAYDIKVDLTVPPIQHARRKVPIDKQAIEEAIDYMVSEGILEQQIEPTPWVSSVTYPVKPLGEVRACLDVRDLNRAIIHENHKPQTVEEIATSWLERLYSQRQTPEGLSTGTPDRRELQATSDTHTQREGTIQESLSFGAKMSQDIFQMKWTLYGEVPRCDQPPR